MKPTPDSYLLRIWGRDSELVAAKVTPDARETDRALCYWFPNKAVRETIRHDMLQLGWVVSSTADPGVDEEGEVICPHLLTVAHVVLRFPSGDLCAFEQEFGYGYPEHSVWFMYEDGNYACDCNRRIFAQRYANYPHPENKESDFLCGDTIMLVSLVVEKRVVK